MGNWKKVFDSDRMHEAEIVKGVLIENDIQAVIVNKKDSYYRFGNYDVMVETDDVLKAIKIIQDEIQFG